ncbi:MAG: S9 family peptidase [Candidatus Zixiibacteriota bacterium]
MQICKKTTFLLAILISVISLPLSIIATPPDNNKSYIPDIGTFMKIGNCNSPQISNTTGQIFFKSSMSGVDQLYKLTSNGWPYQLTLFDDGIDAYTLSYDGSMAIIGASTGGNEDAQLYLLETKTGRITQLTFSPEVRYGSVVWKKDMSGFYYRANAENPRDNYIYYFNLATRESSTVFKNEGSNYIQNLSPDETKMIVGHYYSNVGNDLYLIDIKTGQNEMITSGKENVVYDAISIMPDNKTIHLLCNDNDMGILKRAVFDLNERKIKYIEPNSKWIVDAYLFSPNRRYSVWTTNEDGYSKIYMYDNKTKKSLPSPVMSGISNSLHLTDDGILVFAFIGSISAPDIWRWNFKIPELTRVTNSIYAGIDNNLFVEPELIKYKSFDGLEIPAFFYLPPDYNGQPVPFIVHIHGGPESQFRPDLQRHFQYLLLNGYGIIAPNIRGSDGYGKEYQAMDNYKNRLNSIKDIKAGVEYLIKNNYSKNGIIGIKGASYGGYAVLAAITEYPDLFDAAIDQVGIANYVTFLENTREYRRHIREAEYGPLTDPEFLKSISPIYKADKIKTPLLVIHGENDPRVPIGEARQIIEAIQKNGGVVDSLIFSDEGHGVDKLENRLEVYRKMVEFFDANLKK